MKYSVFTMVTLFILTGCQDRQSDRVPSGRYQLQVDQDGNAWRLDIVSGETKRCWRGTPGATPPSCITAIQTNER